MKTRYCSESYNFRNNLQGTQHWYGTQFNKGDQLRCSGGISERFQPQTETSGLSIALSEGDILPNEKKRPDWLPYDGALTLESTSNCNCFAFQLVLTSGLLCRAEHLPFGAKALCSKWRYTVKSILAGATIYMPERWEEGIRLHFCLIFLWQKQHKLVYKATGDSASWVSHCRDVAISSWCPGQFWVEEGVRQGTMGAG